MGSENGRRRGLLVDYGGVLTSNLFDSFRSFCGREGIEPDSIGRRFRTDPQCRELVIALETGRLQEEDFELRFGEILGVTPTGLIDRQRLSELFDAVVISGEVGIRKPATEIYELGRRQLGLGAADCVFVDDLPSNLAPAAQLGMATVHHVDAAQTIVELERLLAVELR